MFDWLNDYNWQPSMFPEVDNLRPKQSDRHQSRTRTSSITVLEEDHHLARLTEHRLKLRKVN